MANSEERWELARQITATEYLLHRLHHARLLSEVSEVCTSPLTVPQVHMVLSIHERGSVTIKQLAEALGVKAPAASTMVERLVELGVLTREENPADRREVLVQVSPAEESKIRQIERCKFQLIMELLEKIGPEKARIWFDLCVELREVLEKERAGQNRAAEPGL